MPLSLIGSQLLVAGTGLAMTRFLTPSAKGTFSAAYVVASIAYLGGGLSLPHAVLLRTKADQRLRIDAGVVRRVGVVVMIMALVATSALALTGTVTSPGALVLVVLLPPWMLAFDLASFRALAAARGYSLLRIGQAAMFGASTVVALAIATDRSSLFSEACSSPTSSAWSYWRPGRGASIRGAWPQGERSSAGGVLRLGARGPSRHRPGIARQSG